MLHALIAQLDRPSASVITTAIFISEVEITEYYSASTETVEKFAATPECERIPIPTTLSLATPLLAISCAALSSATIGMSNFFARSNRFRES